MKNQFGSNLRINKFLLRIKNSSHPSKNSSLQRKYLIGYSGEIKLIIFIFRDTNLNPKDFIVAYEDRFLGVIEVPFEDFI